MVTESEVGAVLATMRNADNATLSSGWAAASYIFKSLQQLSNRAADKAEGKISVTHE
jgi:hypothetical protein